MSGLEKRTGGKKRIENTAIHAKRGVNSIRINEIKIVELCREGRVLMTQLICDVAWSRPLDAL
jgi:hypothetical protein